jgi:hypothetical protein
MPHDDYLFKQPETAAGNKSAIQYSQIVDDFMLGAEHISGI